MAPSRAEPTLMREAARLGQLPYQGGGAWSPFALSQRSCTKQRASGGCHIREAANGALPR